MLNEMKILFLTTVLPRKRRMGSEVASQSIIDVLAELGAHVTVVGYIRQDDDYRTGPNEISAGRRVIETRSSRIYPLLWLGSSFLQGLPYSIGKYKSREFIRVVNGLLKTDPYDLVIIDHVQMSWLADTIAHKGKTIGLAHNVEHQMYRSFVNDQSSSIRRWIFQREGRLLEKLETRFANQVDQMWTLTKHDADYFQKIKENGDAKEIPLPASGTPSEPASVLKEFGIGLIGSWTWKANEEGLRWFFDMVYPHCSPDISICIAGSGAGWLDGRYPNVRYMGFVDDARVFLEKARVVAIPTLSGGGIQIKTLDAIASGSQIVATPLALRGIADPPSTVSVAETAEEFADKLLAALNTANTESSTALAIEWSRQRNTLFSDQVSAGLRSLFSSQ
jgi:hypothetical protein